MKYLSHIFMIFLNFLLFLISVEIVLCADCMQPQIKFPESKWDFGNVAEGSKFEHEFIVENTGDDILKTNRILGSCACFKVSIEKTELAPGEKTKLTVKVDTSNRIAKFKKYVYVESNDPKFGLKGITITGYIEPKKDGEKTSEIKEPEIVKLDESEPMDTQVPVCMIYFTSSTCEECRATSNAITDFKKKYQLLSVREFDIGDIASYGLLLKMEKKYGKIKNAPPIIFVGTKLLDGWDEVRDNLEKTIRLSLEDGTAKEWIPEIAMMSEKDFSPESLIKERFSSIGSIAVISAGLIDGINPCAFTTIVFFVSLLGYLGKSRHDIFLVGVFFTLAIFLTYLLIGLGLFRAVKAFSVSVGIARGITYAAASLAIILGLYSLYDFIICIRKRSHSDMKLKLPRAILQRIHSVMKSNISSRSLIIAAIIIGFMVSVLESICTGQVYLPTIVFVLRDPVLKLNALSYLVLYNFMFIIPLVIIFLLVYFGVQSSALTKFTQRNLAVTKLLLTLLFLSLGILLFIVS